MTLSPLWPPEYRGDLAVTVNGRRCQPWTRFVASKFISPATGKKPGFCVVEMDGFSSLASCILLACPCTVSLATLWNTTPALFLHPACYQSSLYCSAPFCSVVSTPPTLHITMSLALVIAEHAPVISSLCWMESAAQS